MGRGCAEGVRRADGGNQGLRWLGCGVWVRGWVYVGLVKMVVECWVVLITVMGDTYCDSGKGSVKRVGG